MDGCLGSDVSRARPKGLSWIVSQRSLGDSRTAGPFNGMENTMGLLHPHAHSHLRAVESITKHTRDVRLCLKKTGKRSSLKPNAPELQTLKFRPIELTHMEFACGTTLVLHVGCMGPVFPPVLRDGAQSLLAKAPAASSVPSLD